MFLGMLRDIIAFDLDTLVDVLGRSEESEAQIRRFEEQSGEFVPENARQAVLHPGVQDAAITWPCTQGGWALSNGWCRRWRP